MDENVTRNLSARDLVEAAAEPGERESGVRECVRDGESEAPSFIYDALGPYEMVETLGSGAMGHIYRARHVVLDRMVAIKVLRPELASDEVHVQRFVAEARAVNLLHHPHVIDVMDIGLGPEPLRTPWFVMELLEGVDLAQLLTRERIDLERALRIVRQVCEALEAIHAAGIVHRDVKPENIFLTQVDGRDYVKLIDFGVARLSEPLAAADELRKDNLIGTPRYMAPEQIGDHPIDQGADVYAVGSVLFELISGDPPFDADDLPELLHRVMVRRAPLLSSRATLPVGLRDDLDRLLAGCLEKRACDRPRSARALIESIDAIAARLAADAEPTEPVAFTHDQPTRIADEALLHVESRRASGLFFLAGGALAVMGLCLGARLALVEIVPTTAAVQAQALPAPALAARVVEDPIEAAPVEEPVAAPAVEEQVLVGVEVPNELDLSDEPREPRRSAAARRRRREALTEPQPILTVTPAPEPSVAAPAEPLDRDGVLDPFQ
jgi:serine/threonine-protein kinase